MSTNKESLYQSAVNNFAPKNLYDESSLSQGDKDFLFTMRCNGYFALDNGKWGSNPNTIRRFAEEFKGERVAFCGPNQCLGLRSADKFFSADHSDVARFSAALIQVPVQKVIRRYQDDEDQVARIAFLLGGLVRHSPSAKVDQIKEQVKFVAQMGMLGEERSIEAIATAMSMYVISGGSLDENNKFKGAVYHMADAIKEDPIVAVGTEDLGLSQLARLRNFGSNARPGVGKEFPDIAGDMEEFCGFPTVGAEFHFPLDAPKKYSDFWERLAILNMSMHHRGNYVQFSRNDQGVIEVRMNPSIYPVTVANWMHMKVLLPELERSYFTVTLNRNDESGNFSWTDKEDKKLLDKLRAVGMLSYAGLFDKVPRQSKRDEINFGNVYLGQTVRKYGDDYEFSGLWSGGEGSHGQLGVYAGFGDNLPHLAYLLSMALVEPKI